MLDKVNRNPEGFPKPVDPFRIILYLMQEHLSARMSSGSDRSMSASLTRTIRQVPRRFDLKPALLLIFSVPDTVFLYIISVRCPLSGVHDPSLSIGNRVKIVPDSIEKHLAGPGREARDFSHVRFTELLLQQSSIIQVNV